VLSLAIGIGANTTIFTLVNAILFQPAPAIVEPGRLVDIGTSRNNSGRFGPSSYLNYVDIRQRATLLDGVYGYSRFPDAMTLGAGGTDRGTHSVFGNLVTSNYFTVLGAVPALGRLLNPQDSEAPGATPLVVLSHRTWQRLFDGDPGIVGRGVTVNGAAFTVVGVAAEGFRGTGVRAVDLWVPIGMVGTVTAEGAAVLTNRASDRFLLGARLKRAATLEQAAAEMEVIGRTLERDAPEQNKELRMLMLASSPTPGNRGPVVAFLLLLTIIVSFVLIVACANVAGVLLARASARRKEMALRLAIGAGRSRIIRQLLTETLLLFVLGGGAGLLLARALTSMVASLLPSLPFPVEIALTLDTRVIGFSCGLSLVAALLCGLVPARQASKVSVVSALKEDAGAGGRLRLRQFFVVGQVACSIVLIVVAGLFIRALLRASSVDLGFDRRGVELATFDLRQAGYTKTTGPLFMRDVLDRLRALPDVQSVSVASGTPGGFEVRRQMVEVPGASGAPGETSANGRRSFDVDWTIAAPGYFATLKVPLAAGRDFSLSDGAGAQPVAIVSEAAARDFWPAGDAIGKYLVLTSTSPDVPQQSLLVVGVARDVQSTSLIDGVGRPGVYVPFEQHYTSGVTILARTTRGQRIAEQIRTQLRSMNPNVAIKSAQTLEESVALGLLPQRVTASVSGTLGAVGLMLAGIGIYGVTAYAVARRTREIGIRLSLGARRADIVRMILREGLSLTLIGAFIGLVLAGLASQILAGFLFGIPSIDPVTFLGTTLLFVAIALIASYRPMRRAMNIDPTRALRYE
jgi:predicted permease